MCDRGLHQPPQTMHDHKDVQEDVQIVGVPESIEGVPAGVRGGKNIHDDHNQGQEYSSNTCNIALNN